MRMIDFMGCLMISIVTMLALNQLESKMSQPPRSEIVSYQLVSNKITLQEPVIMNFAINNVLAEPIMFDLGRNRKEYFRFTVKRPNGVSAQVQLAKDEGIALIGRMTLQPGQSYKARLLVNEWFDFLVPGKYEIFVQLYSPIRSQKGLIITTDTTFRANIEIAPRNTESLKRVSENLLNQIIASNSYEKAAEATLALGHIRDSVAVPYLEKALRSSKLVEPVAIEGLARIKTIEAVQVLISALNLRNPDFVALVKATLFQLETEISDPSIKQQIKLALGKAN